MATIDLKTITCKRPFRRVVTRLGVVRHSFYENNEPANVEDHNLFVPVTQADFLEEYYPGGHRIYDTTYFPDIWRQVSEPKYSETGEPIIGEDGQELRENKVYCERVPRYAFAFQQIIAMAHITHATGNDVQHELAEPEPSEATEKLFDAMCSDWIRCGMERAWYESYKSREITGDAAFVGFMDEKHNFSWRVFSYQKGDRLYPHYDQYGKLEYFVRATNQYDENEQSVAETLEVWDDTYMYVYRKNTGSARTVVDKARALFGASEYTLVSPPKTHGFPCIPVAYVRDDDGPGWSPSQDQIDCYELSFSQMAHNNQAYGEAILVLKSRSEIPIGITRDLGGTVKQIDLQDPEDEASYLEGQSASESYLKQLETLEDGIYRSSNAVKVPDELRSGDTPASAIKLLFANALNQAAADGMECEGFINDVWLIFACAYGLKNSCLVTAMNLPVHSWIKPFVHLSESAVTADLVALKNADIISAQTAAERASFYSKPGEARRIREEKKAMQDIDLLYEREQLKAQSALRNTGASNETGE